MMVGAREYDPEIGRFLQPDPQPTGPDLQWGQLNRWAYCANDPVNASDPSGQRFEPLFAVVGAILTAIGLWISGVWGTVVSTVGVVVAVLPQAPQGARQLLQVLSALGRAAGPIGGAFAALGAAFGELFVAACLLHALTKFLARALSAIVLAFEDMIYESFFVPLGGAIALGPEATEPQRATDERLPLESRLRWPTLGPSVA